MAQIRRGGKVSYFQVLKGRCPAVCLPKVIRPESHLFCKFEPEWMRS